MIYTVTMNPSLDYIVEVDDFKMGMTNRTVSEKVLPGGKGINVSIVLKNLLVDNVALGFEGGFTGKEIVRRLDAMGLCHDFIHLSSGISRINTKIKNVDGTELNGRGPDIEPGAMDALLAKLDVLGAGDVLVLAGSVVPSMGDTVYRDMMARLLGRGVLIVVDATKKLLLHTLSLHPFLIKPNHHELGELFGTTIYRWEDALPYGKKLQEMGAKNVLVSMGGEGALLFAGNGQFYRMPAPKGKLVNAVGAGDSMVAGFLAGWLSSCDYEQALSMAVAAGSASAFCENLASRDAIIELLRRSACESQIHN